MKIGMMAFAAAAAVSVAAISAGSVAFGQSASDVVTIDGDFCKVYDAETPRKIFTIFPPSNGGSAFVEKTITPAGILKFTCSGTLPDGAVPPTQRAILLTESDVNNPCTIRLDPKIVQTTDDWQEVITPSGQVNVTCLYNPNSP